MIRVADYVIDKIVKCGIKHIFMVTGRGILYLTDAVAKNKNITAVSTYHEQGASYAAMAYAAATDGMAACLVSTGCAAANAVTAALCAYQDNLPVIFISGQNMLNETTKYTGVDIRTFGSQEADIIPVVASVTKYATMLTSADSAADELNKAIKIANDGRKGPVWIDIPLDIQNARLDETKSDILGQSNNKVSASTKEISTVVDEFKMASRPIIFIGGGIRSAEAIDEVKKFVELNGIPLVYSTAAADAYGSGHKLSIGAVGSLGGSRAGNFAVQNADYILAIGTKLCSQSIGESKQFARGAKVVVVDIDEIEHTKKGPRIDRVIISDAREFLKSLNSRNIELQIDEWVLKCQHWKEIFAVKNEVHITELISQNKIDLYNFADVISDFLPDDASVITDAGLEELIIPSAVRYRENQRCLFPAAQGAMGYAIPAILGAHYAGKENIVTVVGDGSIMMNIQELQLIGNYRIPAKIFVINNNMYAVIRKRQHDLFRNRTIGNDPSDGVPAPDFEKLAYAFGLEYKKIGCERELAEGIRDTLNAEGPCMCEVMCVEDQKYLHTSFAFTDKRRLVKRPLEDLSPFIDRELFKSEMIVNPIEE